MKSNLFGLDIGTTTLKAVWLSGDVARPILHACMSLPTPAKGMLSESVQDLDQMAVAIKKLVTDAKITTNLVNIALAENQVFTKVIDMPILSDKELSSAIYWEAEQYIPAPLSTITLDWRVLHRPTSSETEQKMQVLLVGAPTTLIKKYQNVIELAGLTLASIETEILSVIRSVVVGENFPTSLIINIGSMSTSIAIIKNGIIVFTYSVPLGGIAINRAIANEFGFSTQQAEEYKKTYGVLDEKLGGKIGKAIEPILTALLAEIRKAIAFYTDKYKNESPITQIVIAGETARLPGIDLFFVQNVGTETVIANPWKQHSVQGAPKEIIDTASDYAIAFGLAIKDYE